MYLKVTRSGSRRYVQLVEAYRDENGLPRQKTLATLGRYERVVEEADALINSLGKLTGREPDKTPDNLRVAFDSSRAYGDLYVLQTLWEQLGFDLLRRVFRSHSRSSNVELLLRVMVFNRLCNPESKAGGRPLGVLRWLDTVEFPGDTSQVSHQQLLRAMDVLEQKQPQLEIALAAQLRPLIDESLSVVFYDLTTVTTEGETEVTDDIRRYGRSKDGGTARQVVIGVMQTAEGLPLSHQVFEGNVSEAATLLPALEALTARYPIQRVVLVADRGLLNLDNLAALDQIKLPSGEPLQYILAVPGGRYGDFAEVIRPLHEARQLQDGATETGGDWMAETRWQDRRLVIDHCESMAAAKRQRRRDDIANLEAQGDALFAKLDTQERGDKGKGRKLSDGGATAKFYQAVKEARLGHLYHVDMESDDFGYLYHDQKRQALERLDGKLLLVTNVMDAEPQVIIDRYRSLADIERGFRVLKSELEIGPMYHRLPQRIRAHAAICFIALILYRVMRYRLQAAGSTVSPERSLEELARVQQHQIKINGTLVRGLSTLSTTQLDLLKVLEVPKPPLQ
jgi:transposase